MYIWRKGVQNTIFTWTHVSWVEPKSANLGSTFPFHMILSRSSFVSAERDGAWSLGFSSPFSRDKCGYVSLAHSTSACTAINWNDMEITHSLSWSTACTKMTAFAWVPDTPTIICMFTVKNSVNEGKELFLLIQIAYNWSDREWKQNFRVNRATFQFLCWESQPKKWCCSNIIATWAQSCHMSLESVH